MKSVKRSAENLAKLADELEKVNLAKGMYHSNCRKFEEKYLEQKILEDISRYHKNAKAEVMVKQELRKFHDELSETKEIYESVLDEYNQVAPGYLKNNV